VEDGALEDSNLFLREVNALIEKTFQITSAQGFNAQTQNILLSASSHLCLSKSAKRLRPLACLYFSWLFDNEISKSLVCVSVAAEFIHAASLMHDDIIDCADKRRGALSVNQSYGNSVAVLAGDFLLTEAFLLIKSLDQELTFSAVDAIRGMTKASMEELSARGDLKLNEMEWRNIARGKTGSLFAWCAIAPSIIKKEKDRLADLWEAGFSLGLIFQMADDIKDFSGDGLLKDPCRDIMNKEQSLPIIIASQKNTEIKGKLLDLYAKDKIELDEAQKIASMIMDSGALLEIKALMNKEIEQLLLLIKPFEASFGYEKILKLIQKIF